jgi:ubiquinone/menaquinone biosynthesis C-methylase UbiE
MTREISSILGCQTQHCGMFNHKECTYTCNACSRSVIFDNGIFVDNCNEKQENLLEQLDYDKLHGVSIESSIKIANGYIQFLKKTIQIRGQPRILEIGSGTGLLTLGLAISKFARHLIVSDISKQLLRQNYMSLAHYCKMHDDDFLKDTTYLCCSIANMPIKPATIDVILGNSILHHVYDYRLALLSMARLLADGGVIVLSEPVVQGKFITALVVRLMLEFDKRLPNPQFSKAQSSKMAEILVSHTKEYWISEAERKKGTADDKHLFDVNEIENIGHSLGFSVVQTHPVMPLRDAIEINVAGALRILGLDDISKTFYDYICEAIKDVLIPHVEDIAYPNHAFLVFRR